MRSWCEGAFRCCCNKFPRPSNSPTRARHAHSEWKAIEASEGEKATDGLFRSGGGERLKATSFIATNKEHVEELQRMGIQMTVQGDGRVQLVHSAAGVSSADNDGTGEYWHDAHYGSVERMQSRWMDMSGDMLSLVVLVVLLWCDLMIATAVCICCSAVCLRILRRFLL